MLSNIRLTTSLFYNQIRTAVSLGLCYTAFPLSNLCRKIISIRPLGEAKRILSRRFVEEAKAIDLGARHVVGVNPYYDWRLAQDDLVKSAGKLSSIQKKLLSNKVHLSNINIDSLERESKISCHLSEKTAAQLPIGCEINKGLLSALITDVKSHLKSKYSKNLFPSERALRIPESGLVCSVIQDNNKKCIYLCFGGTGSGYYFEKPAEFYKLRGQLYKQNLGNLKNFISSSCPRIYKQAELVTKSFLSILQRSSQLKDYKFALIGHSLGGGLAMYSAAMNSTIDSPIHASCFSSAELGNGCFKKILEKHDSIEKIQQAVQGIYDYTVEGDNIANLRKTLGRVQKVGNKVVIPANAKLMKEYGTYSSHFMYDSHIKAYKDEVNGAQE